MRAINILLVDDEPMITETIKIALEGEGFTADIFNRPSQALDQFDAIKHNAALLDFRMPEMNGVELARRLLKMKSNLQICIFTATEIEDTTLIAELQALNINCIIKKPMALDQLAKHIESHFVKH